jgi:hypothetical protein
MAQFDRQWHDSTCPLASPVPTQVEEQLDSLTSLRRESGTARPFSTTQHRFHSGRVVLTQESQMNLHFALLPAALVVTTVSAPAQVPTFTS